MPSFLSSAPNEIFSEFVSVFAAVEASAVIAGTEVAEAAAIVAIVAVVVVVVVIVVTAVVVSQLPAAPELLLFSAGIVVAVATGAVSCEGSESSE